MIDPRLMHDRIEMVSQQLGYAVAHATRDPDLAMFHTDKAQRVVDEIKREVYWASRRSGEVRK